MGKNKNYKTYDISCGKCQTKILTYHKYGAGKGILRLYFDHIVAPDSLATLGKKEYAKIQKVPNLSCSNEECGEVLGVPTLSKKGKWVFRMRQGLFHRKLIKK